MLYKLRRQFFRSIKKIISFLKSIRYLIAMTLLGCVIIFVTSTYLNTPDIPNPIGLTMLQNLSVALVSFSVYKIVCTILEKVNLFKWSNIKRQLWKWSGILVSFYIWIIGNNREVSEMNQNLISCFYCVFLGAWFSILDALPKHQN